MGRNEVGVNLDDVPTASPLMDLPEVLRARLTSRFLPRLSVLAAFGIALFFVAAGMAVRLLFAEELGQRATFIFFVPGVVVAGALSGLRAGTLAALRSEEQTSELQSLMRNSYAVFFLKKKKSNKY